ncbi:hypothetical protein [Thermogutta sp.]|uniref:hypothetical protein n=1 Tax=Thermogutta sp. TaxID=1962930 RepID=UPI00322004F3
MAYSLHKTWEWVSAATIGSESGSARWPETDEVTTNRIHPHHPFANLFDSWIAKSGNDYGKGMLVEGEAC